MGGGQFVLVFGFLCIKGNNFCAFWGGQGRQPFSVRLKTWDLLGFIMGAGGAGDYPSICIFRIALGNVIEVFNFFTFYIFVSVLVIALFVSHFQSYLSIDWFYRK